MGPTAVLNSKLLGPHCVQISKDTLQVQSESLGIMGAIKSKGAYISSVFNRDGPRWQQSDNHKLHTLRNKFSNGLNLTGITQSIMLRRHWQVFFCKSLVALLIKSECISSTSHVSPHLAFLHKNMLY